MTKTKTRIKTNIVTKIGIKTDPFIGINTKIDPTTKTKVKEVVSLVDLAPRNDYMAQDPTPSTSQHTLDDQGLTDMVE
jgi:hypothetical protein